MSAVTCPNCGHLNRPGAKFCQNCRTPLGAGATQPSAPPSVAPTTPTPTPAEIPTSSVAPPSGMPTAPAPPGYDQAGVIPPPAYDQTGISPPPGLATAPASPSGAAGQIMCPNCGAWNRPGAKFCQTCRTPLATELAPQPFMPVSPPIAPFAPVPTPPIQPAPPPPSGIRLALLIPFLCLLGALGLGLSSVFGYESGVLTALGPTPTATGAPEATFTPRPTVATPTSLPTFTPVPTPVPGAQVLMAFVATAIPPDQNKGWTAWPGQFGFRTADGKPLTFRLEHTQDTPDGRTNNTRVWIDGPGASFGSPEGEFGTLPELSDDGRKLTTVWKYKNVVFTQVVELTLSASNQYDAYRISYSANNQDNVQHEVSVRLMVDTMIGDNDGVYFSKPDVNETISKPTQIPGSDIADFYPLRVLENPDLSNPGVTLQVLLSGAGATRPSHFEISQWCYVNVEPPWDYLDQFGATKETDGLHQCGDPSRKLDTAIGLFFEPKVLQPGESNEWMTYYGISQVLAPAAVTAGKSSVSFFALPQQIALGEQFPIIALIQDPKPGQTIQLTLPPQLELVSGNLKQAITQTNVKVTQISWKVRAAQVGSAKITVNLQPDGVTFDTTTNVVTPPTPAPAPSPTACVPSPFNRCFITPSPTP